MSKQMDKIEAMSEQLSKTRIRQQDRGKGRPAKNMPPGRFVRLTAELEAAVELHRLAMEESEAEPVEFSRALRDVLRAGAKTMKLL